jgi:hypothetical protein
MLPITCADVPAVNTFFLPLVEIPNARGFAGAKVRRPSDI